MAKRDGEKKKYPFTVRQTVFLSALLLLILVLVLRALSPAHVKFRRLVERTLLAPASAVGFLAGEIDIGAATGSMAGDEQNSVVRILSDFSSLNTLSGRESVGVLRSMESTLLSVINEKNVRAEKRDVTLFTGEKSVNCTVYTFSPDRDDLVAVLTALSKRAKDNAKLFTLTKAFYVAQRMETENTTETLATRVFEGKWENFTDSDPTDIEAFSDALLANGFTFTMAVDGRRLKLFETAFTANENGVHIRYASDGDTFYSRQDRIEVQAGTSGDIIVDNSYELSFPRLTGTLGTTGNGVTDVREYDILLLGAQ